MNHFKSFVEFQVWLNTTWFPTNQNAVQLDGRTTPQANRATIATFELSEIPNIQGRVSLHGDTTVSSLKIIASSAIEDFLIVPPQQGDAFVNWRFHHKSIHKYTNDSNAEGMFAYIK